MIHLTDLLVSAAQRLLDVGNYIVCTVVLFGGGFAIEVSGLGKVGKAVSWIATMIATGLVYGAYEWVRGEVAVAPPVAIRVIGGLFVIIVAALILFGVKVAALRTYAVLEIGFALSVAVETLLKLDNVIQPIETLKLLAAAYLLIRGMDNLKKSLDEQRAVSH